MKLMMRAKIVLGVTCAVLAAMQSLPSHAQNRPGRGSQTEALNKTLDAARLAQQATLGVNRAEIDRIGNLGVRAWMEEQFAKPQTMHQATVVSLEAAGYEPWEAMMPSLWKQYFEAEDHLRQRVANALSQTLVISLRNNILLDNPCGPASYLDMLGKHAFGNFRDILKNVTLHPAMGEYLDMKKSGKETAVTNPDGTAVSFYPNENYARELLQLFSIGTVMLNADGTVQLDGNGKPIPSYDESIVQGFAKAFTGWTFAPDSRDVDANKPWRWLWSFYPEESKFPDAAVRRDIMCKKWSTPMAAWTIDRQQPGKWDLCNAQQAAGQTVNWSTCTKPDLPPPHDTTAKKLLNGATLPAGQTPMQDVDGAIDNIFNHPNVGPFITKQLIQRLVMSNPSPAYVARVATVFNNNGNNVRGDMKSVLRAILIDNDARLESSNNRPEAGKLREPAIRWVQFLRAFDAKATGGDYRIWDLSSPDNLGQVPLNAPSVFNFYHADALLPFQPVSAPVTAPEFELATSNAVAGWSNFFGWATLKGFGSWYTGADVAKYIKPNYTYWEGLAQNNVTRMVDELNVLLAAGRMSSTFRNELIDAANKLTLDANTPASERMYMVLWLIANSPEFLIQK
jgi:uncharacterized protein (DUF1800 family)